MLEGRFNANRIRVVAVIAAAGLALTGFAASSAHARGITLTEYCGYARTPVTEMSAARAELAVHCLINRARLASGVAPQHLNKELMASAEAHAEKSVALRWWDPNDGSVSHVDPETGSTPGDRIAAAGYCPGGSIDPNENTFSSSGVWEYPATPGGAVRWWLHDPPHRATLLSPRYKEHGIAVRQGLAFPGTEYDPAGTFVEDLGTCG
jgi:uncharacterized protein YkwD